MRGMEYRDYSGDALAREEALYSAEWVMQQKFDGTRALIDLETLQVTQRNGKPLKHTAATQHIPAILQDLSDISSPSSTMFAVPDTPMSLFQSCVHLLD